MAKKSTIAYVRMFLSFFGGKAYSGEDGCQGPYQELVLLTYIAETLLDLNIFRHEMCICWSR